MSEQFAAEVERIRRAGVPGPSGRLTDLFDFLAARGPDAAPATQAEIADAVFRQAMSDNEDATVRVYVHRLRKRLDEFYRAQGTGENDARLDIPSGIYSLQLLLPEAAPPLDEAHAPSASDRISALPRAWLAVAALALLAVFLAGFAIARQASPAANAIWAPLIASDRPVLLVLGDYYLFGEIDPVRPEMGRLIRDFRVNSSEDLLRLQEAEPDRYGFGEDQGLSYLPFSSAFAIQQVSPILAGGGKQVEVIAASDLQPDMLNRYDVVYLGLLSGMGLLEDAAFQDSGMTLGDSYDELRDGPSGRRFVSEEARSLASPTFYRDYGLLTRFAGPGGAEVVVLAGTRETGLRALSSIAAAPDPLPDLDDAADAPSFIALIEVTGQQGADLSERLVFARPRE